MKLKYGQCGAIVSDTHHASFQKLEDSSARFYGGPYFVCESASPELIHIIADGLRASGVNVEVDTAAPQVGDL